jgi:hypothetical protein
VVLTDAEAATPGLRTISTIIPQARALNTLKYAADQSRLRHSGNGATPRM